MSDEIGGVWLPPQEGLGPEMDGRLRQSVQKAEQIDAQNQRLQRAMTETNHRVKNNLTILSAFIEMEINDHTEVVPVSELRRVNGLVRTLAAVHDILMAESEENAQSAFLSARTFLEKLLPMIRETIFPHPLRYVVEDVRLPARQGRSLALVTNELIMNAVKHGRNDVEVRFAVGQESATLEVYDDGPGFPPDFDPARSSSTGLRLIASLVGWDLRGQVRFENRTDRQGGRAIVTFPL